MEIVILKCPSCGANVKSNDNGEYICDYCGTIFSLKNVPNNVDTANYEALCESAIRANNAIEALKYVNEILKVNSKSGVGWFLKLKAICLDVNNIQDWCNAVEVARQAVKYNTGDNSVLDRIYALIIDTVHKNYTDKRMMMEYELIEPQLDEGILLDMYAVFDKLSKIHEEIFNLLYLIPQEYFSNATNGTGTVKFIAIINDYIDEIKSHSTKNYKQYVYGDMTILGEDSFATLYQEDCKRRIDRCISTLPEYKKNLINSYRESSKILEVNNTTTKQIKAENFEE